MSTLDTSKPVHLNVGGSIRTIIPNELINSQQETDTFFTKLFTQQIQQPIFTPSNMFTDPIYFVNCPCDVFNMILNWLKYGMINKSLSEYQKLELIHSCEEMNCLNLMKILQNDLEKEGSLSLVNTDNNDLALQIVKSGTLHTHLDLSGRNLKNFNMDGTNTLKKHIVGDFSNSDLTGSRLTNSTFDGCNFSSSKLNSCNFEKSNFINCILDKADLTDVNFKDTSFDSTCSFKDTIFKNTFPKFDKIGKGSIAMIQSINSLQSITFEDISFNSDLMKGKSFTSCRFEKCEFVNCVEATISKCTFNTCKIEKYYFQYQETDNCFQNCRMYDVQFYSLENVKGCSFYQSFPSISIVDKEYALLKQGGERFFNLQKRIPNENRLIYSSSLNYLNMEKFKNSVNEKSTPSGFIMFVSDYSQNIAMVSDAPIGKEGNLKLFYDYHIFDKKATPKTDSSYLINVKSFFVISKKGELTCLTKTYSGERLQDYEWTDILVFQII